MIHIATLAKPIILPIYSSCEAWVALLISTKILVKYFNFLDIFSLDSTTELLKYTRINNDSINLSKKKQRLYGLIYSLKLVEVKTLKTYIKANIASSFIMLSKFPASTRILFIKKKDSSFHLCVDYRGLNNLTTKNYFPLPLINELLNCLGCAKHFN